MQKLFTEFRAKYLSSWDTNFRHSPPARPPASSDIRHDDEYVSREEDLKKEFTKE